MSRHFYKCSFVRTSWNKKWFAGYVPNDQTNWLWTSRFNTTWEPEVAWIFFASAIISLCFAYPTLTHTDFLLIHHILCILSNSHSCEYSPIFTWFIRVNFGSMLRRIRQHELLIWVTPHSSRLFGMGVSFHPRAGPWGLLETPGGNSGDGTCSDTLAPWRWTGQNIFTGNGSVFRWIPHEMTPGFRPFFSFLSNPQLCEVLGGSSVEFWWCLFCCSDATDGFSHFSHFSQALHQDLRLWLCSCDLVLSKFK